MEKLFTNEQLDKAINDLPNDGSGRAFNGLDVERQKYIDAIYRHLKGLNIVGIFEAGNHVISAHLTSYGITFKFNGGFCGKGNEEKQNNNRNNILCYIIAPIVVGIILWLLDLWCR